MTNMRRVPAILLQILTRLPSGSRVLTPTPTPPLRRENRILWLALQTLLPRVSRRPFMRHTLNANDGMGRPPCPAFKAAQSYCSQPTESASAEPLHSAPRSNSSHSLNRQGLVQLFSPIRALRSFWCAQVTQNKKLWLKITTLFPESKLAVCILSPFSSALVSRVSFNFWKETEGNRKGQTILRKGQLLNFCI